ncbi:P-loop containing nucleoside triphosphate hydrolase protein [Mycena belliarum]|uniref:P-loop containing nucleoside triphosphate hydrolase protein n=1 Tax=Mycena belliarum TaxID=1033014 RepID=A0AAD6XSE5_9AGAR|nr:P-loop containing nucleoside triphosphate hydrolase protein [Mycena belliae]
MASSQLTNRPITSLSIPTSTLSALLRAGYETVEDLDASNAEKLAQDLSIPLPSSQAIFTQRNPQGRAAPLTQTAAAAVSAEVRRIPTRCAPLDKLLGGGLPRRHILELSGPPGTPKGAIAIGIVRQFLKESADEQVLFLDTQNMTTASALRRTIPEDAVGRVFHHVLQTLPELVSFVVALPSFHDKHPKLGLLVLGSLHFPFQSTSSMKLSPKTKNDVLENMKPVLVRLASRGLTIVVTSQLATKMLGPDGSPATFDTGTRAVMVPQLAPSYLPSALSFRVMICPQERFAGVFRLLQAPGQAKGKAPQGEAFKEESYNIPVRRMIPVSVYTVDGA